MRFAAADIAADRGAAQRTDKSADRSRKNNSGAEHGGIEKVLINLIVVGGCDEPSANVIPPFFRRYAYLYNDEELGQAEAFLLKRTKLEEYEKKIKLYHDLARRISIEIERTIFAGFFEVSHALFVAAVVENVEGFKGLLIHRLVDRYQNTTKK